MGGRGKGLEEYKMSNDIYNKLKQYSVKLLSILKEREQETENKMMLSNSYPDFVQLSKLIFYAYKLERRGGSVDEEIKRSSE